MADAGWTLEGFGAHLDVWIEHESPDPDLRYRVISWVLGLHVDPFKDAHRETDFENMWSINIPGSIHTGMQIVFCSYWVDTSRRVVRCDQIATLTL